MISKSDDSLQLEQSYVKLARDNSRQRHCRLLNLSLPETEKAMSQTQQPFSRDKEQIRADNFGVSGQQPSHHKGEVRPRRRMKQRSVIQSMFSSFLTCNDSLYNRCDECVDDDMSYAYGNASKNSAVTSSTDESNTVDESTLDNSTILSHTLHPDWETIASGPIVGPIYRDLVELRSELNDAAPKERDWYQLHHVQDDAPRDFNSYHGYNPSVTQRPMKEFHVQSSYSRFEELQGHCDDDALHAPESKSSSFYKETRRNPSKQAYPKGRKRSETKQTRRTQSRSHTTSRSLSRRSTQRRSFSQKPIRGRSLSERKSRRSSSLSRDPHSKCSNLATELSIQRGRSRSTSRDPLRGSHKECRDSCNKVPSINKRKTDISGHSRGQQSKSKSKRSDRNTDISGHSRGQQSKSKSKGSDRNCPPLLKRAISPQALENKEE